MPKFAVGEIAILVPVESCTPNKENMRLKGEECEIMALPRFLKVAEKLEGYYAYSVKLLNGDDREYFCAEYELRKKDIPPELDQWAKDRVQELFVLNPAILTEPAPKVVEDITQ